MSIFSTREVALGIWLIIIIAFIFLSPKIRPSALQLIKVALSKQLLTPFLLIAIYAVSLTLLFSHLPLWKDIFIKDIVLWVLFTGVPVCYGAINSKSDSKYFKNILFDNFKFTILVEFIISSFTFSLWVEIVTIPAITFITLLYVISGTKEEYSKTKKLLGFVLAIIGFTILFFTIKIAIVTYTPNEFVNLVVGFFIPIVFSIAYIPFAYIFALYAKYEIVFMRMDFKTTDIKTTKNYYKRIVFSTCKFSYKKILAFEKYVNKMYKQMSEEIFLEIIKQFNEDYSNH